MKPLKTQFSQFVQWTDNIEDRMINFHIDDAFFYVVKATLGYPQDANKDLALSILEYNPGSDTSDPELESFFDNYVLRWWILVAFRRFLANHGRNVTQFGYTNLLDPEGTFNQVDEIGRATYLRSLQSDINVAETNMFLELNKRQWTFDGFQYSHSSCKTGRKNFEIRAIGAGRGRRGGYGCRDRWYLND